MSYTSFCKYVCRDGLTWAKTMAIASKVSRTQIELWSLRVNQLMHID